MNYSRFVSLDLSYESGDQGVPEYVTIPGDAKAGHKMLDGAGTIVQWLTGEGFVRYICLLTFEDWETEKCPRFAYYRQYRATPYSADYRLCANVSECFDWDLMKGDN